MSSAKSTQLMPKTLKQIVRIRLHRKHINRVILWPGLIYFKVYHCSNLKKNSRKELFFKVLNKHSFIL